MNKRKFGELQEEKAALFLQERGYFILERNFYSSSGEIDLIATEGEYLCFIEVRYRTNSLYGFPEESITPKKQKRIVKTAEYYRMKYKIAFDTPCRFDVLCLLNEEITLYQNAFEDC